MDAKVMATNLKDKVDELSYSTTSSAKSINKLKTYVSSAKKASNTAISKLVPLAKKWRSSEKSGVKGSFTTEEEPVLTTKAEYGRTGGVPR